jgi:hypothetical protein
MVVALFMFLALIAYLIQTFIIIMLRKPIGYLAIKYFVSDPISPEMGKHIIASNPYMLTAYLFLKLRNFILVAC